MFEAAIIILGFGALILLWINNSNTLAIHNELEGLREITNEIRSLLKDKKQ